MSSTSDDIQRLAQLSRHFFFNLPIQSTGYSIQVVECSLIELIEKMTVSEIIGEL